MPSLRPALRRTTRPTLIALALSACVHAPPPVRELVLEPGGDSVGPRPFVRAKVAGVELRLLLDTGAPENLIPAALARSRRLRTAGDGHSILLMDANGTQVTLVKAPGVPVLLPGADRPAAVDFYLQPAGEGVLAPQTLLAPGWAMSIDLERHRVRFDPQEEALAALAAGSRPIPPPVPSRGCMQEGIFSRAHRVVQAKVNGVPVEMAIDTGAQRTTLTRNNPALASLASAMGRPGGVSGLNSTGHGLGLEDVPVEAGGARFSMAVLVVPASSPCWHGVLGTDLLRHCSMVWGWDDTWLECQVPGAGPPIATP